MALSLSDESERPSLPVTQFNPSTTKSLERRGISPKIGLALIQTLLTGWLPLYHSKIIQKMSSFLLLKGESSNILNILHNIQNYCLPLASPRASKCASQTGKPTKTFCKWKKEGKRGGGATIFYNVLWPAKVPNGWHNIPLGLLYIQKSSLGLLPAMVVKLIFHSFVSIFWVFLHNGSVVKRARNVRNK